jgi:hypothetical protein
MTAAESRPPSRREVMSGGASLAMVASAPTLARASQADEEARS